MSDALNRLRDRLDAIPAADVRRSSVPMDVFHRETNDLIALVRKPEVASKLTAIGVDAEEVEELDVAHQASVSAQEKWLLILRPLGSEELPDLENDARDLRSEIVSACRYHLAGNRRVQSTIDAVQEGNRLSDLIEDLGVLRALVASHPDAFADDQTFDAKAAVSRSEDLAAELRSATGREFSDLERVAARDLRDRAFTFLYERVLRMRRAGRHAFRDESDMMLKFGSRYRRSSTNASRVSDEVDVEPEPTEDDFS